MIAKYKGQAIKPYETFNWDDSRTFAKPSMGGGIVIPLNVIVILQ